MWRINSLHFLRKSNTERQSRCRATVRAVDNTNRWVASRRRALSCSFAIFLFVRLILKLLNDSNRPCSLVSSLRMITFCVESIFCSSLTYQTDAFIVYVSKYLAESLRSCSTYFTLFFALERYTHISNMNSSHFFVRLSQSNLVGLIISILILSFSFTYCKIVEIFGKSGFFTYKVAWFIAIYVIHFFLNDIVAQPFILVLFLMASHEIKIKLKKKEETNLKILDQSTNSDQQQQETINEETLRSLKSVQKSMLKVNAFMILIIIFYVLFKIPFLAIYIALPFFNAIQDMESSLISMADFLFMFNYMLNLPIYTMFSDDFVNAHKKI